MRKNTRFSRPLYFGLKLLTLYFTNSKAWEPISVRSEDSVVLECSTVAFSGLQKPNLYWLI